MVETQPDHQKKLESFVLLPAAAQVIGDWEPETGRLINQSKGWVLGLAMSVISKRYGDMRHACLSILCLAPNALARDLSPIKEKNYGNEKGICEKKRQNISKRNGKDQNERQFKSDSIEVRSDHYDGASAQSTCH